MLYTHNTSECHSDGEKSVCVCLWVLCYKGLYVLFNTEVSVCMSLSSVLQWCLCIVQHLSQLTELITAVKYNLTVVPCNCFPAQKLCSQISWFKLNDFCYKTLKSIHMHDIKQLFSCVFRCTIDSLPASGLTPWLYDWTVSSEHLDFYFQFLH